MLSCSGNRLGWLVADLESMTNPCPHRGQPRLLDVRDCWLRGRCRLLDVLPTPRSPYPSNARRMSVHPAERRSARHAATHAVCAGASRDLQSGVRFKPGEWLRGLGIRRFDAGGYTLRPHTDHHARGGADVNALKDVRPMQFRVIAHRGVSVKRGSRFAKREF